MDHCVCYKESQQHSTFKMDLTKDVPRMLELVNETRLPRSEEYPGVDSSFGIDLSVLESLQTEWTTDFDWKEQETALNRYKQYTTTIEGLTVHFVHEKSQDPDAIPLLLNNGWPGQDDFREASLLRYRRVFNTLMTEVLGYDIYAVHGTDWGSVIAYSMYDNFNATVRALHLNFLPLYPLSPDGLAAANITLTPEEESQEQRFVDWAATGMAYFSEQTTKASPDDISTSRPNTIGLALYDNPMGQLAWIGEKYIAWSDPRQGTPPSLVTHTEILREVSLYYLTRSFISSVYIYAQNPNGFKTEYTKADNDAPFLYSSFKYNVGFWPKAMVEKVGKLVSYTYHDFGGHFPGLDNPPALIEDLREIATYWTG
ncbi:Alpha/Beta hydrolase protein [Xylariales sp. AK1849]|nr:Alpha/Beta hydrolase protein [Xylariales sp. AK1849]